MRLWIVPGSEIAWFVLLGDDEACLVEAVPLARFLDALTAYGRAGRFGEVDVAVPDPADLLPWTGNV